MTPDERKRQERERKAQQMGSLLTRTRPLVAFCVCGARVATVQEILMCEHGKTEAR